MQWKKNVIYISSEFVLCSTFSLFFIWGAWCHIPVAENISLEVLFRGCLLSPIYLLCIKYTGVISWNCRSHRSFSTDQDFMTSHWQQNKLSNISETLQNQTPANLSCSSFPCFPLPPPHFTAPLLSQTSPSCGQSTCFPTVILSLHSICATYLTKLTQFKGSPFCEAFPDFIWAELDLLWALCVYLS